MTYGSAHPTPADILLVVEVSDSTLRYDRDEKMPLYARHRIPEVWIVDLQSRELRWYRSPLGSRYLDQGATRKPGVMQLPALPGVAIDLKGLLSG